MAFLIPLSAFLLIIGWTAGMPPVASPTSGFLTLDVKQPSSVVLIEANSDDGCLVDPGQLKRDDWWPTPVNISFAGRLVANVDLGKGIFIEHKKLFEPWTGKTVSVDFQLGGTIILRVISSQFISSLRNLKRVHSET